MGNGYCCSVCPCVCALGCGNVKKLAVLRLVQRGVPMHADPSSENAESHVHGSRLLVTSRREVQYHRGFDIRQGFQ